MLLFLQSFFDLSIYDRDILHDQKVLEEFCSINFVETLSGTRRFLLLLCDRTEKKISQVLPCSPIHLETIERLNTFQALKFVTDITLNFDDALSL